MCSTTVAFLIHGWNNFAPFLFLCLFSSKLYVSLFSRALSTVKSARLSHLHSLDDAYMCDCVWQKFLFYFTKRICQRATNSADCFTCENRFSTTRHTISWALLFKILCAVLVCQHINLACSQIAQCNSLFHEILWEILMIRMYGQNCYIIIVQLAKFRVCQFKLCIRDL